jgi:hypothetical protein|tara:strand:- start:301 stop:669 length:369 start_codon:yes stop_codon:yes gene_type:complete
MKPLKLREDSAVDLSLKNLVAIVVLVSMGIFAYTEITSRLTSLETSRELMNSDLLKASDQKTIDGEQYLILESAIEDLEKLTIRVDEMMHNGVNISRMIKDIDRLRNDVETLKDKVRKNGHQ